MVYADYTASGKSLTFIEDYLRSHVLPIYGNTHSSNSATSTATTLYMHEAREMVLKAVNGNRDRDVAIFTGSGSTAAVNKMVSILGLGGPNADAVVFVSLMDHHSNLLPWRESGAQVVTIGLDPQTGGINMSELDKALEEHAKDGRLLIGSFPAASNVTGVLIDTKRITKLLHVHGALAFFDYATAAPYVKIDMNPAADGVEAYMDAIFVSPHKFVGGPGTPGLLVAKTSLFDVARARGGPPTSAPGGGTVFFVSEEDHAYLGDIEYREEGGTPPILGAIRTGMVFQLQTALGHEAIAAREAELVQRAHQVWDGVDNLVLLGPEGVPESGKLAIFSFLIRAEGAPDMFLHHGFVTLLLNDLFGIQARGGCACAGPYAAHLLAMSAADIHAYVALMEGDDEYEISRPGFCRVALPFFAPDAEIEYILKAVAFVAEHGVAFLPSYSFIGHTTEWVHAKKTTPMARQWIQGISYASGQFQVSPPSFEAPLPNYDYEAVLGQADALAERLRASPGAAVDQSGMFSDGQAQRLRWFMLPYEAGMYLKDGSVATSASHPVYNNTLTAPVMADSTTSAAASSSGKGASLPMDEEEEPMSCPRVDPATLEAQLAAAERKVPPKKMLRQIWKAVMTFEMLEEGDRVLVGVSGGKDSLTLLHVLLHLQKIGKTKFEVGAVTVDPQTEAYDPSVLIPYMKALGVPYFYESEPIVEMAKFSNGEGGAVSSICSFCSRMKRGMIYSAMRREGYNVLAFGQHLDDFAESFFMSVMFNGCLRTMKAHYWVMAGDLRVIRPLVYLRESDIRQFAYASGLPVVSENCPGCFAAPMERYRIKRMLAAQEAKHPKGVVFGSLKLAMKGLIGIRNEPQWLLDQQSAAAQADADAQAEVEADAQADAEVEAQAQAQAEEE